MKMVDDKQGQSLRDTIVVPYPNNEMVIVLFELMGNCDLEDAFQLEFSPDGRKLCIYNKVPRELQNAVKLIGARDTNADQDADCVLLNSVIEKRLNDLEEDENGDFWQPQEIIELPFACHRQIFSKYGDPMQTFLVRKNDKGYAWAYFWLIGQHVGKKVVSSPTIRGEASTVSSADSVVFLSQEDEMSIDSVQHNRNKQGASQETGKRKSKQDAYCRTETQQEITSLKEEIKNLKQQVEKKSIKTASIIQEHESKLKTVNEQHNCSEKKLCALMEKQNEELVQLRQERISKDKELENLYQQKSNEKQLHQVIEKQKQEIAQLMQGSQEKTLKHNKLENLVNQHKSKEKELHEVIEQQRQEGARLIQQLSVQSNCESKLQLEHTHQVESQKHKIELLVKESKEVKQKLRNEENKWNQLKEENKSLVKQHFEAAEELEERIEEQRLEIIKLRKTGTRMEHENEKKTILLEKKKKEINNLEVDVQTFCDKVAELECERMKLATELLAINDNLYKKERIEKQLYALVEEKQREIDRLSSTRSEPCELPIFGQNTNLKKPGIAATNLLMSKPVAQATGGPELFHKKHNCAELTWLPIVEDTNQTKLAPDSFEEKQPGGTAAIDSKDCSNINPIATPLRETPKVSDKESTITLNQLTIGMDPSSTTQPLPADSPKQAAIIDGENYPSMNPLTTPLPESPKGSNNEDITNEATITKCSHSPRVSDASPPPKHLKQMKERRKRNSISNPDIEQPEHLNQLKRRQKRKSESNADMEQPPIKQSQKAMKVVRRSRRIQYRRQVNRSRQSPKNPSLPLQFDEMNLFEKYDSSAASLAGECLVVAENVCTNVVVVATENK